MRIYKTENIMVNREDLLDRLDIPKRSMLNIGKDIPNFSDDVSVNQPILKINDDGTTSMLVKLSDGYYEQVVDTATNKIIYRKQE